MKQTNKRKNGVKKIENNITQKDPIILDFSGDETEAIRKLASILYTSGWNNYIIVDPDMPSEDKLLFSLIRERAIDVGEVYYIYKKDFTEELKNKAYNYFHRLRKRDMDSIYLNAVNHFSKHEPDIEKTCNGALFYPAINAYVRCGNLSPEKLLELMQKDDCKRVIVFGSDLRLDREQPWEAFHSFEMNAPKEYILQRIEELQEEKVQGLHEALEKSGANEVFKDIFSSVYNEEQGE